MKIFCHVDLDGRCSGAILTRKYPLADVKFYNYNYDWMDTFSCIEPGEPIIFADITPRIEDLRNLMVITKDITIIDHHSSSYDDLQEAGLEFPGLIRTDELGACALVLSLIHISEPTRPY